MSPISAATTTVLRRLRAVTFCDAAPVRIDGFSTCFAWSRSWLVCSLSLCACARRIWTTSLSVADRPPLSSA